MEHATSVEACTIYADSTKRKIRTWQEAWVAAMFIPRDDFFVLLMLSSEISHALRFIADPNKRFIDMVILPIANIDIDVFRHWSSRGLWQFPGPRRCTFKRSSKFWWQ